MMVFKRNIIKPLRHLLAALTVAAVAMPAGAASFSVTAKLDSATLLMGYTTRLRLSVDQPKDAKVSFPLLRDASGRSYIGLLGDTIEISPTVKLDTASLQNGRIRVNYNLTVQAFDSGTYTLPPFEMVSGNEVVKSNTVSLRVVPVRVADDAEISGFTDIEPPLEITEDEAGDGSFWRTLLKYWWLLALLVVFAALLIWGIRRYRSNGTLLPVKPVVPPYDEAIESLDKLKRRKLWEKGKEKEYFTGLTFILRRYLMKEYNIPALEMTSRQIMAALKQDEDLKGQRDRLRNLLDMADFVKYAKVRPLPEDNEAAYSDTDGFIKEAHARYLERKEREAAESSASTSLKSAKATSSVGRKKKIKLGRRSGRKRK